MTTTNLQDILPQDSETVRAIYEAWKRKGDSQPKRAYLGGSEIGHHCERYLWYKFRDGVTPNFDGRLYRLFDRGHREEATFVEELRAIGCEVHEVGPDGKQFEVSFFGGHFKGHADGVALGIPEAPKTWHLLEMKTASAKSFNATKSNGVQKDKPQHYGQMQVYMHLMDLKRALYIVANKDTDELYSERVRYDKEAATALLDKARRVIFETEAPSRPYERDDFYLCKWCDARELCWGKGKEVVPIDTLSCRQCCHATAKEDGSWTCERGHEFGKPCDEHLFLPDFIRPVIGEPTDATATAIRYESKSGKWWTGKHPTDNFTSKELLTMPRFLTEEHDDTLPDTDPDEWERSVNNRNQ